MKKSDLKLLQERLQKASQPPPAPKKKDDLSDELSKLFDDGTVLASEKGGMTTPPTAEENAPRLTSPQPGSAHLGSPQPTSIPIVETSAAARTRKKAPVAPDRDFNRRPNSLERDALPAGLFPGTSKKLYDALFLRTRGAHPPTRTIKATRTELMKWSGIGSRNTFLAHMRHLTRVGLIIRHFEVGDNNGAVYEICVPEEIDLNSIQPSAHLDAGRPTSAHLGSPQPGSAQNLVLGSAQKVGRGGPSQTIESNEVTLPPNTFIKTNTEKDDDEALAGFISAIKNAAKEITGKELSAAESERWTDLANVLITELKIAAGRTTVSNVPAFLAEHLRRRLWKKEKRQIEAEAADTVATAPAQKIDASQCPDCFGTGMWYPEGFEKGVARCRHEKLNAATAEIESIT
jgi:hypothetical protein